MRAPTSKQEWIARCKSDLSGLNMMRTWESPYAAMEDEQPPKRVGIRHLVPGRIFHNQLDLDGAGYRWAWFKLQGIPRASMYVQESTPDTHLTLNAEIQSTADGLYLHYSTMQANMRDGLRMGGQHAWGLKAQCILRHHLWPADYDDVMALVEADPEGIVEASAFDMAVGAIPCRNTVVWEWRRY